MCIQQQQQVAPNMWGSARQYHSPTACTINMLLLLLLLLLLHRVHNTHTHLYTAAALAASRPNAPPTT
jgi:hypothetical protein